MKFKHSCFISFRHGQYDLMSSFIRQFEEALAGELDAFFDVNVFVDWKRLEGGDIIDTSLAEALCKSICMVYIYVPKYFSSDPIYCTREFLAMRKLEAIRYNLMGENKPTKGYIIPVALRAEDTFPESLKKDRLYYDFGKFTLAELPLNRNPNFVEDIGKIARYIYDRYNEFQVQPLSEDPCNCCGTFDLPLEEEAFTWIEENIRKSRPKLPFRT